MRQEQRLADGDDDEDQGNPFDLDGDGIMDVSRRRDSGPAFLEYQRSQEVQADPVWIQQ